MAHTCELFASLAGVLRNMSVTHSKKEPAHEQMPPIIAALVVILQKGPETQGNTLVLFEDRL